MISYQLPIPLVSILWATYFSTRNCSLNGMFCMVVWLVVFYVSSTARSFRDGTPIYCPLWRTWSSVFTPTPPGIKRLAVVWQSITQTTAPRQLLLYGYWRLVASIREQTTVVEQGSYLTALQQHCSRVLASFVEYFLVTGGAGEISWVILTKWRC